MMLYTKEAKMIIKNCNNCSRNSLCPIFLKEKYKNNPEDCNQYLENSGVLSDRNWT